MTALSRHPASVQTFLASAFLALGLSADPCAAATYEVGPGMPMESLGEVPWESLGPGDLVLVYWRTEPYAEKLVLCRQGTEADPIVVRGVPGPLGELPVLDGHDATTRPVLDFWNEDRGVVKIGGANVPEDTMPAWIVIENLEIRSARPPYGFTGRDGAGSYADNAAAVYIEKGEHLVLANLVLHDSGNGLFAAWQASDVLVESCHVHGNGNVGSYYEHNSYTEADGIVFQYNHYGPLCDGCLGNNLKDRSAGTVVRYNWIEGGNRQLDLVESDHDELVALPAYRSTFVYGNVLVEHEGEDNRQILHYGGDGGDESYYRKGILFFFGNTVVSTREGRTTLMRLSSNDESADCRDNVLYVTAAGSELAMLDATGVIDLRNNWTKPGWVDCHGTLEGTVNDLGGAVEGTSPGFADEAGGDYHLDPSSDCIDAGTSLPAAALPDHALAQQYVVHQGTEPRPVEGALDIGAFETCVSGSCPGAGDEISEPAPDASPDPAADASTDSTGDTPGDGPGSGKDAGCGCTLAGSPGPAVPGVPAVLVLVLFVLALARRLRAGRSTSGTR